MSARTPAIKFIFLTLLLDVLGFGLLIPVAPRLVMALQGHGESEAAYVVGALAATYAAMQFIFAPILGSLSDRFGRRPVILISLLGSGLDYLVAWVAPNLTWLFATRAVNGMSGANMTAASAYVADVTPPEKRAAGFGMIGAAFGIGFVVGPLMGGILGQRDIRLPFLVAGILTLINWVYGLMVLPESLPVDRRRVFSWRRANPVGAFKTLSHYPIAAGLAASAFLINLAQFGLHATWVLYTRHRYGWDTRAVGWSLFAVGVSSAIVQGGLARRIIPRLGEPRSLIFGMVVGVIAFAGYGLATQGWMIYAIVVIASIGGIANPAAQSMITKSVRPDEQGEIQGALTSLQCIANIAGPLIGGSLFGYFTSEKAPIQLPGAPFFSGAALSLLGLINALIVLPRLHPFTTVAGVAAPAADAP